MAALQTPLSKQLQATAKAVAFVMSGRSLSDVLADGSVIRADMRGGVQALSFAVLRHWGLARALAALLVEREPPPQVHALLCTALALLVSEPEEAAIYTEFTLVNQAVEAAKDNRKTATSASFLNAVLRRFLRERTELMARAQQSEEALLDHPQWWIDRLRLEQPVHWRQMLLMNQIKPPLTLRVNTTKTTTQAYAALLAAEGINCEATRDGALLIRESVLVPHLPRFADGWCSVQDAAAQGAARQLLSPDFLASLVAKAQAGQKVRVLDACAAPGGKTSHLLELLTSAFDAAGMPSTTAAGVAFEAMPFHVLALEVDAQRAKRIHENTARLKLRATVKIADAANVASWWDGLPFDAVLLDAPCTASGIVRRHPDVRWLRRESDIEALAAQQRRLLQTLWGTVAVGGRILYATCSVFQAEGDGVVQDFVAQAHKTAEPANWLDSQGLWLPSASHDGFYDALLEKRTV